MKITLTYHAILGFEGYEILPLPPPYSKKRRVSKFTRQLTSHTNQFCANVNYNRRNSCCNKKRYELIA